MAPSAQDVDPESDGVEVNLNYGSQQDSMEVIEFPMSYHPDAEDHWHEGEPEDAHHTHHGKFHDYDCIIDPDQFDHALQIKLCSFKRPHMRAFHLAWWSYHVAFLMWFSISPLPSEVQISLNLSKEEVWTSSIAAVSGTIIMWYLLGLFCDKYGPCIPMGIILLCSAIRTGLTGLVNTATGLSVNRFFIGIGGSTFVMCLFWTSTMFTKEWVGTANATVGGWGNLGGGVPSLSKHLQRQC